LADEILVVVDCLERVVKATGGKSLFLDEPIEILGQILIIFNLSFGLIQIFLALSQFNLFLKYLKRFFSSPD